MSWLHKHFPFKRFILLHVISIIGLYYMWDPLYLLYSLVGYFIFALIGFEICLHRYFAHRSFTCSKPVEVFLIILSLFSCGGNPIQFALYHRTHHRYSDTDSDPHIAGTTTWHVWFQLYNKHRPKKFDLSTINDLKDNKWYQFIENWGLVIYLTVISIFAFIDLKFTLYFFIISAVLANHDYSSLNVLCHKFGYRTYNTNDKSTNNPWCVWMLGGQWHNNHHNRPWRYTNTEKRSEWDLLGWLIKHVFSTSVKE